MKRLGVILATAGGAGYFPFASGTVGSAIGLVIYLLTRSWPLGWQVALLLLVTGPGIWAGGVAAEHFGREDPGPVIIDEVAGQLLTLIGTGAGIRSAIVGFLVFRVLDIFKPWPAGRFEQLPGGFGIMADDLMVAVYGNIFIRVLRMLVFGIVL
jgi:phosphatidylglycerophosphatase A